MTDKSQFYKPDVEKNDGRKFYAGDHLQIEDTLVRLREAFPGLAISANTDAATNTHSEGVYNVTYTLLNRGDAAKPNVAKMLHKLNQQLGHIVSDLDIREGQRVTHVHQDVDKGSSEGNPTLELMPFFAENDAFLEQVKKRQNIEKSEFWEVFGNLRHALGLPRHTHASGVSCKDCSPGISLGL